MPCSEAEVTPDDAVFRSGSYTKWFQVKLCQMVPSQEIEAKSEVMPNSTNLEVGVISEATMTDFKPYASF